MTNIAFDKSVQISTRRAVLAGAGAFAALLGSSFVRSQEVVDQESEAASLDELEYTLPFDLNPIRPFGNSRPAQEEIDAATLIWSRAPRGPAPINIVDYFATTIGATNQRAISQWPNADAWNPLVVNFFSATTYRAVNDLVPWCAAFTNWCLDRSGRIHSGSSASQSFLWYPKVFKQTMTPKRGDLVVFTCYYPDTGKSTGLGHVGFVDEPPASGAKMIDVIGGNQTKEGTSMICSRRYPLEAVPSTRTINGRKVPVTFKFNTYIEVN